MKTLYLVRHAKSSWDDPALADNERPLDARGKRDAPKVGKRLLKAGAKPDLILSSPAKRALTTARIIAKELGYKRKKIVVDDRLYAAEANVVLDIIQRLDKEAECVMLFGHNPELTELAHRLSSQIKRMPTCAVAQFTFGVNSWARIGKAAPATADVSYPPKK